MFQFSYFKDKIRIVILIAEYINIELKMDTNEFFDEGFNAKEWFAKQIEDIDFDSIHKDTKSDGGRNDRSKTDDFILKNIETSLAKIISFQKDQMK